jgi:hypothetical protein
MENTVKNEDKKPRINFGLKYRGRLVSDIIRIDPAFIKWAVEKGLLVLPNHLKL